MYCLIFLVDAISELQVFIDLSSLVTLYSNVDLLHSGFPIILGACLKIHTKDADTNYQ